MTKNIFYAVCFLLVSSVAFSAETVRQVLGDREFSKGFTITGQQHADKPRIETFDQKEVTPLWRICQWNSKGKLENTEIAEDTIRIFDEYKSVTLDRKTGAINLTDNAIKEWDAKLRTSQHTPWPHLLLEQSPFKNPISIAKAKNIWVEFDFEITVMDHQGEQNPDLHTAQVGWFLYLKNVNPDSPGYRDFLWFGTSLFDARVDFTKNYAAQDFAMPNGSFIYTIGSETYLKEKCDVGRRQKVRYDILPEIEKALKAAHAQGFMKHSQVKDLTFDGTNIGWEIPGVYNAGITLHKLSVEVIED